MIKITLDSEKGQSLSVSGTSDTLAVDLVSIAASLEGQNPVTLHLLRTALEMVDATHTDITPKELADNLSKAMDKLEVLANELR